MGALDAEIEAFGLQAGLDLKDLDQKEFPAVFEAWSEASSLFVLLAKTTRGEAPVGVVAENRNGNMIVPHVLWLPWASSRNKLEAAMRFVNDMRRESLVVIYSRLEAHRFWALLSDYGILKLRTKPGGIPGWYGDDSCEIWTGK